MSIPGFPVYIFDVDGTLVDSAVDICGAVEQVLTKNGVPPQSFEFLRSYIGRHLDVLFKDLIPDITKEKSDAMVADYRTIYHARGHAGTKLYSGVDLMLAALGGRKSTATTKGTPTTRIVLEQFGLISHFEHVQGTDGFPAKPEPDVILKTIELFGVRREDCLFIGDSTADMEAGKRSGVKVCGVGYGYGDIAAMRGFEPDYWIDSPAELLPR